MYRHSIAKATEGESFLRTVKKSTASEQTAQKLEIVKHIINVRQDEADERAVAKHKADRKRKLLDLLAEKDEQKDAALSREDILKELESLLMQF